VVEISHRKGEGKECRNLTQDWMDLDEANIRATECCSCSMSDLECACRAVDCGRSAHMC
jgi:hypothetical protein